MKTETYNAIMQYRDQMITDPYGVSRMCISLFYSDKETTNAIMQIARDAGHKVTKRIIGRGDPDAEVHLTIN